MNELEHKNNHKKLSHRITITCDLDLYNNLRNLQQNTHMKSLSRTIDILLNDELNNRPKISPKTLNNIKKNLPQLCQKVGQLNQNIMGACNNLNQIAYKTNIKNLQGQVIKGIDFMGQNGIKMNQLATYLVKYAISLDKMRKEMNQIWRLLM